MHAILRPLEEVTAAVAMALGETSIWEISYGAAQGGGWRIGNTPTPNLSSGNRTVGRGGERDARSEWIREIPREIPPNADIDMSWEDSDMRR